MMLWRETETKLVEDNQTDVLPRILGVHTAYLPFRPNHVYVPMHGWHPPKTADEMTYKHYDHISGNNTKYVRI